MTDYPTTCPDCGQPLTPTTYNGRPAQTCPTDGGIILRTTDLSPAELKSIYAKSGLGLNTDGTLHT